MKAKPDIPGLFQKSVHKLEEMPSPQIWNRLEQRLDRRKQQRVLYFRLGTAAAVLVLAISGFLAGMYVNQPQIESLATTEPFQLFPLPVNQSPDEALKQVHLSRRIYRNVSPSEYLLTEGEEKPSSPSEALKPSIASSRGEMHVPPGQLAFADQPQQTNSNTPAIRKESFYKDSADTDLAMESAEDSGVSLLDGVALAEEAELPEPEPRTFEEEVAPSALAEDQVRTLNTEDISKLSTVTTNVEMESKKASRLKRELPQAFPGLEGSWASSSANLHYQQNLELSRKNAEKLSGKLFITTEESKEKHKFTLMVKNGVETLEVSGKGTYQLKEKTNGDWIFENSDLFPSKIYFQKSGGQSPTNENEWRLEKK